MNKEGYVLDASALLAVLGDEPGAERIRAALADARIGAVNLAEVVGKLQDRGVPDQAIDDILLDLDLKVVPFDAEQAVQAGKLRAATKAAGLSLGDRACLALAGATSCVALTTDQGWTKLELDVTIELAC